MAQYDLAHLQARPGWQDPIVIVGAGPVGMSAALGLAHYDVPCIVLDDGEGPAIEGSRHLYGTACPGDPRRMGPRRSPDG